VSFYSLYYIMPIKSIVVDDYYGDINSVYEGSLTAAYDDEGRTHGLGWDHLTKDFNSYTSTSIAPNSDTGQYHNIPRAGHSVAVWLGVIFLSECQGASFDDNYIAGNPNRLVLYKGPCHYDIKSSSYQLFQLDVNSVGTIPRQHGFDGVMFTGVTGNSKLVTTKAKK